MPRSAFTMVEMVMVVAILALVAGMATVAYGGISADLDEQAIRSECATVRSACLRFAVDAGRPPGHVAELLLPPAEWWWEAASTRPTAWDPAIRRGWNGPYLEAELSSTADQPTGEDDLESSGGQPLGILTSEYAGHPQDISGGRWRSHLRLKVVDGVLCVQFLHDPKPDATGEAVEVVCSMPTGLKP